MDEFGGAIGSLLALLFILGCANSGKRELHRYEDVAERLPVVLDAAGFEVVEYFVESDQWGNVPEDARDYVANVNEVNERSVVTRSLATLEHEGRRLNIVFWNIDGFVGTCYVFNYDDVDVGDRAASALMRNFPDFNVRVLDSSDEIGIALGRLEPD